MGFSARFIQCSLSVLLALLAGCATGSIGSQDFDGDGTQDNDDCDPSNASIYPGAEDPYGDTIDQDCDGADGDANDLDNDGTANEGDCAPEDADIYPGAEDTYGDGIDQDCDGLDGVDSDGDGYASTDSGGDDCNDGDAGIHPGADDPDDAIDQDCDGFGRQTTVDLRPDAPTTSDELYLQVVSDSAVLGITWFLDGVERTEYSGFQEIPHSQTSRDQTWRVDVTPYSATGQEGAAASDSVIIGNSAPSAATLTVGLVPDPKEGDVLTAIASASDDDLDTVTMLYAWFVNEVQVSPSPGEQLDSTHFDKGDSIYVVLTPSDGSDEGTPVTSNTVTAVNTAPLAVSAALDPTEGTEETTFVCTISGWQDPDPADSEAYDFQWYVNGVTSVTTASLDGTSFERGDTVRCEATPNDGEDTGSTLVSSVVTVSNTLPSITSVTIDPTAGDEGTTFTCLPAGWVDPDPSDATPHYSFQWYVGPAGSEVASVTTETIDGTSFDRDDSIYCEVTPINELGSSLPAEAGAPVASAALVVANTVPQITSASIEPAGATTSDTLYAYPGGWTDADGDGADYLYQWWIEDTAGNVVDGGTDWSLAPGETLRGDSVTLEITPTDGTDSGSMVLAGPVVIANTPPGAPVVSAIPGSPQISDDLVCSIATESVDPDVTDGVDSLSYDFQWLDDSGPSTYVLLAGTASSTLTVPGSATSQGQSWTCEITPSDSEGAGTPDSALLVINSPPSAPTISVSIGTAPADGDLVCSIATPATDLDGDPLSYDFEWLDPSGNVAYSLAGGAESATLSVPAAATNEDDTWTCSVSASDGLTAGPVAQETIVVPIIEICSGLDFDSVEFVDVGNISNLASPGSEFTVEAWVRWDGTAGRNIVVTTVQNGTNGWNITVDPNTQQWYAIHRLTTGALDVYSGNTASTNWQHVAAVFYRVGSTSYIDLFVDGVLRGSDNKTGDFVADGLEHFFIGNQNEPTVGAPSADRQFYGLIDDVRVSTGRRYTATFAPEVAPSTDASTVGLWGFDEGSGTTATDSSGNNHHGTINGATWATSCPAEDLDGDGVPAWEDCDDDDARVGGINADANCDGADDLTTSGGMEFVGLAGGSFEMGCTAGQSNCDADESPAHSVTLTNDFWMGTTEVTQGQYQALINSNPSGNSSCGTSCPVEAVNWYEAAAFANALSLAEGLDECYTISGSTVSINSETGSVYDCIGFRLPTEAEWEFAARAGADLLYSGSNTVDDVAWYSNNSGTSTHPVGTKLPNAWGIYDMSGNVWEWLSDEYSADYYTNSPSIDPVGPSGTGVFVYRPSGYSNSASLARLTNRNQNAPNYTSIDLGFRLARTVMVDGDGRTAATPGTDCSTILDSGFSTGDGNYWIDGGGSPAFEAYCDMSTNGGGWTTFFASTNGSPNVFAAFEDQTVVCTDPMDRCLRPLPNLVTSQHEIIATCGSAAFKFAPSSDVLDFFKNGGQHGWATLGPITALNGSLASQPDSIWTGNGSVDRGWIIGADVSGTEATHTFSNSNDVYTNGRFDYCDGTADTSSRITLGFRSSPDQDGDGYDATEDCDDTRAHLHPYDSDGDGVDDDCGWRHVAAGDYHTCGIDSAGFAHCWGSDSSGASTPPVGAGYEPWLAFGLGEYSSCGITSTNGLECWGNSSRLGTTPSSGDFSVLEVGSWHACAIDANNEIECWGGIGIPAGQMASPTTGSFTDISVGSRHSCAIDSSGAAQCWGCGISYGQCASQSSSFTDITAGAWISCGITTTNAVECWGSNGNGELTDLPNSGTFTSVSSGAYHTCAIATDGSLECWGCSAGNSGQCSQTPSGSFRAVSAGGRHVCAIDTAGAMHCWGSNSDGQSTPP